MCNSCLIKTVRRCSLCGVLLLRKVYGIATWYDFPDITHFEVYNCRMSSILNLIQLRFLRTYSSQKPHILFNSNGLAIWQGFPVITHIEVKSGRRSAIFDLIMLKIFMVCPYLKLHILCDINGLAIRSGFPDITLLEL